MLKLKLIYFIAIILQGYLTLADKNVNFNDIEIRNMCVKFMNKTIDSAFQKIGNRYFYIEKSKHLNWFAAQNKCRQMGGDLAVPHDKKERKAIVEKMTALRYWLGIDNLADEDRYDSVASGLKAPFIDWATDQPEKKHDGEVENCVCLGKYGMHDYPCSHKIKFICQA